MIAVLTVLIVLTMSLIVVRIATVALTMTGISKDLAQFQALSAFTGSGFTTRESEEIVNHPLRRRIVMDLMRLGNAGIVLAVASVMLSFLDTGTSEHWTALWQFRVLVLVLGVLLLCLVASSRYVERVMWQINHWALRHFLRISVHDYTRLLRLSHDYVIWEMQVQPEHWLDGRTLAESNLTKEGILVLGIERRDGIYLGAPRAQTRIQSDDQLILYGRQESLFDLDERKPGMIGNLHHVMAVTKQLDIVEGEEEIARTLDENVNNSPK